MRNESSGILDANALFGDLPLLGPNSPSSVPPPPLTDLAPMSAPVVITEAQPVTARVPRREVSTARGRGRGAVDPMRARLISIIVCGSVALVASLFACFLYVTHAPAASAHQLPPPPAAR